MKSARFFSLAFLILLFTFSTSLYAGVPQMINYQGKITTPTGALVDTTVQMTFTIYDDSTSGNVLWTDTLGSVSVQKGIFSVLLGNGNPIPDSVFDGNIRYLGVKVGADPEMTPRKAMVSVAYAFRAGTADGSGGADCGWVDDGAVVRLETGTDDVGIGTTGPAGKLDVTGPGIFRRGDGIQDKIVLGVGDPNVALELRSETSGGTPFIDFANDDATDFDARIRLKDDSTLAIEGDPNVTLEVDGQFLVDRSLSVASGPSEAAVDNLRSYYTYKGVGASPFMYQGSAIQARTTYGGDMSNPVGTVHALNGHVRVLESGDSENEMTPLFLDLSADASARLWGVDLNVHGPVDAQADLIQGVVNFVNNYNAAAIPNKGLGVAIVTRAGCGGGDASPDRSTRQTYPLDIGLAIVGWSGTPDQLTKTQGYRTALQIGGNASGWMGTSETSKIGTGILVRDIDTVGMKFRDFLNVGAPALSVDVPSVMEISEADSLKWKLSQEGSGVDASLLLRDMTEPDEWWWGAFAGGDKRLSFQKNRMVVMRSGNVGIGTTTPSEKLEVAGTVKMTGFNMPTGAGIGKVLTSDASGAGTWQAAAGGADADWSFRITDTADTSLMTGGAWGIARYGSALYGNADSTHVNLGVACTTGTSGLNYKYCTVGGGHGNTASGGYSTVGGGYFNMAGNEYATVGGGVGNTASGYRATVAGGFSNTASNSQATVGGGASDTASGNYSTVPGGRSNKAAGDYSFAAGRRAKAEHAGSFVWADNTNEDFASTGDNQFLIRASGNVGIGTTSPTEKLEVAGKIYSSSGGFRFPDGTVQTTAAAGGGWTDDGTVVRLETVTDSVGIGTTAPTERLDVSGNIKASGTITSGSSITIDGGNDKITATGGTIDFDDENIVTTGKATIGPDHTNTGPYAFVAGKNNTASGDRSAVSGGDLNTASGSYSNVGGGNNNEAGNLGSTVAGGLGNYASGSTSTIGGGNNNTASGYGSTVGGGISNTASGDSATVGGGGGNVADGPNAVVGGGWSNVASQRRATVGGGYADTANGAYATIGGGYINRARNDYSTIGGGRSNQTNNDYATVGGGRGNNASGYFSTISGGYGNDATDYHASVGGGTGNTASNEEATIGGGRGNSVSGYRATVGGGYDNNASGPYATVAGGDQNSASDSSGSVGGGSADTASGIYSTIGGGYGNSAAGQHATIPGGRYNTAAGDFSLAAGRSVNVDASADYTFAFGYNFTTSTPNAVIFSHPSAGTRMGINLTNPTYAIHLPNNANNSGQGMANAWNTYSSLRWKENINEIDHALDKVMALRGVSFDWKENKKHDIGMIAEEVGEIIPEVVIYDKNGVDAEGLDYARLTALLVEAIKEQQERISDLEKQIAELKR